MTTKFDRALDPGSGWFCAGKLIDEASAVTQAFFVRVLEEITMKIARQVALGAAIAFAAFGQASAQDWPTRSVTVVVPIPAGVASDIIARAVFEQGWQAGRADLRDRESAGGRWYDRRQHGRQGGAGRPYHSGLWLDCGG